MRVLVIGDPTEDAKQTCHGAHLLIAIGTLAGNIHVFNTLGLLIHEIVLGSPITAVEWIGYMATKSVPPNLAPSWVPELYTGGVNPTGGVSVFSDEETGTVKRTIPPSKQAVNEQSCNMSLKNYPSQRSNLLGGMSSHVVKDSPPRAEGVNRRLKQTFFRPRVSAGTFSTPGEPLSDQTFSQCLVQSQPPMAEALMRPQGYEIPTSRLPSFCALEISLSSSEDSECSESEWFTPPDTRRSKWTAPNPPVKQDGANPTGRTTSLLAASIASSMYHSPLHSIMKRSPAIESFNGKSVLGKKAIRHKDPQRHVRIAEETLSPPSNVPNSSYYRSIPDINKQALIEESGHGNGDQCLALNPDTFLTQSAHIIQDSDTHQDPSTNTYPYLRRDTSQYDITTSTSESLATGNDLYTSLDSRRAKSILVRNGTDDDANSCTLITVASRPLRPRSTSSVYSRSISGVPKDVDTIDGQVEDARKLALQHPSGIHTLLSTDPPNGIVFLNSSQAVNGSIMMDQQNQSIQTCAVDNTTMRAIDFVSLKQDNRALRQEVAALREEYHALKDLVLQLKD